MLPVEMLTARSDADLALPGEGRLVVRVATGVLTVDDVHTSCLEAVAALFSRGIVVGDVCASMVRCGHAGPLSQLMMVLQQLRHHGVLCTTLCHGGRRIATVSSMSAGYQPSQETIDAEARYALSRFSALRVHAGQLLLETPLSPARVLLESPEAAVIIHELRAHRTLDELRAATGDQAPRLPLSFMNLLLRAGMLSRLDDRGEDPEVVASPMAEWDWHELLFHSRSRRGRHDYPWGGGQRFAGKLDPPATLKPRTSDRVVSLHRPDIEMLERTDVPLTAVLERRRSLRAWSAGPLPRQQLGELLFRAARVVEMVQVDLGAFTRRTYPGGGAIYELEIYPVVSRCDGIDRGLYRYLPDEHGLERIEGDEALIERLLTEARHTAGQAREPQILFIITSRFGRIGWKYQAMAYALTLKNVGVLFQNMYLVATAMGLAPCALGGGDTDLFGRAAGLEYLVEGAVGEFAIGVIEGEP
ncbi:SagB family peptide dehydrogenase [Sorangium sp. So ce429]